MTKVILQAGSLAYYDHLVGLVSCKVLGVQRNSVAESNGALMVTIKFTHRDRNLIPYTPGETITIPSYFVYPREAVYTLNKQQRIREYQVKCDDAPEALFESLWDLPIYKDGGEGSRLVGV